MYIHYSIGNNSGLQTLVHIVEVSVIGGIRFRRFHCTSYPGPAQLSVTSSMYWK